MLEETLPAGEGSVQSSPPTVGKAPDLMSAFQTLIPFTQARQVAMGVTSVSEHSSWPSP